MLNFLLGQSRSTVPVPKFINPRMHAVLDYATAAVFFAAAYRFRRHRRASALAMVNGTAVLGASLFTDYPGGVWRRLSFKTHGRLDALQATLAGTGPTLLGFSKDREARLFYAQAAVESQVIASTAFEPERQRNRSIAAEQASSSL